MEIKTTHKTQKVQPQQVIERIIVKTEQVETIKVLKTVTELKEHLLLDVKAKFKQLVIKPRVEVVLSDTLTTTVDGGRNNKDDFKEEWEDMADTETTTVKNANNDFVHGITKAQMYLLYKSIVKNGKMLYAWKWQKEAEINACTTIAELEAVVI